VGLLFRLMDRTLFGDERMYRLLYSNHNTQESNTLNRRRLLSEYRMEAVYASRGVLAGLVGVSAGCSVLEP
jgi:hypothetical protein